MSADELNDIRDETRRVIDSRRVWAGPIFAVEEDALLLSEGASPVNRQTVAHHDAVSVVALREGEDSSQPDGAAEILLVRQYRHPVRAMLWEVPAGLLDVPGEDPVDAARRELAEETDYRAEHWQVLVDYYASPGFTTEGCRSFLATGLSRLPAADRSVRREEEAEFVPTWFRLDDVVDAVLGGRVHNPATVSGVLALEAARSRTDRSLREPDARWLHSPRSL